MAILWKIVIPVSLLLFLSSYHDRIDPLTAAVVFVVIAALTGLSRVATDTLRWAIPLAALVAFVAVNGTGDVKELLTLVGALVLIFLAISVMFRGF